MSDVKNTVIKIAQKAKASTAQLRLLSTEKKNVALKVMADALLTATAEILAANAKDMAEAETRGQSKALLDRLLLTESRIKGMAQGLKEIAELPDPVGETIKSWNRPNGLEIRKVRVPIGVVAIVYEARPNVTADCVGLCLKSSNAVILRGGSEAHRSSVAMTRVLEKAARRSGVPDGAIQLVPMTDRKAVDVLLSLVGLVDVVIPRGGEGLIRTVVAKAKVPVIKQYKGVCHTYVDDDVDLEMARRICFNAKVQRPGVCNAMETLLVNKKVAKQFLPAMAEQYVKAGVELRVDPMARKILKSFPVKAAKASDWPTEYLDLILSVKVVDSLDEAIRHIAQYGSSHSEAIVTRNRAHAEKFMKEIDAACVYVNASTRFTDGGEFGLGAEIGVSTDKLHARGPMGLEELTTYKYEVVGTGQVRS